MYYVSKHITANSKTRRNDTSKGFDNWKKDMIYINYQFDEHLLELCQGLLLSNTKKTLFGAY